MRCSEGLRTFGDFSIGPSLPANGQITSCVAPEVASHLAPGPQVIERTFVAYPDMRMCLPSTSRQPCNCGSCIAVTRKRPSGENAPSRCEPFHSSFFGFASGALGDL